MSKKIDERIPNTVGKGVYPDYPAVASPWGRLYSFREAAENSATQLSCVPAASGSLTFTT